MTRNPRPYFWSYYLPSMGVVLIQSLAFIVPPKAIPGRTTLLITTVLLQMEVLKDAQVGSEWIICYVIWLHNPLHLLQSLVPTQEITKLVRFVGCSIIFILLALFEYCILLLISRLQESYRRHGRNERFEKFFKLLDTFWSEEKIDTVAFLLYWTSFIIYAYIELGLLGLVWNKMKWAPGKETLFLLCKYSQSLVHSCCSMSKKSVVFYNTTFLFIKVSACN